MMRLSAWSSGRHIETPHSKPHDLKSAHTSLRIVRNLLIALLDLVVSEYGYGIALLNESKYGYAVQGNVMRLSLLRAPQRPDPKCDRGKQIFSFAIYPHAGTYVDSDVQVVAHAFNSPLRGEVAVRIKLMSVRRVDDMTEPSSLALDIPFIVDGAANVMVQTVKCAEDGTKSMVLRMNEHLGGRGVATFRQYVPIPSSQS